MKKQKAIAEKIRKQVEILNLLFQQAGELNIGVQIGSFTENKSDGTIRYLILEVEMGIDL